MDTLDYAPTAPLLSGSPASDAPSRAPDGLGDALLEAAEHVLGPAAQWAWRRQARQLASEAALAPWFSAASRYLRIDCLPVVAAQDPARARSRGGAQPGSTDGAGSPGGHDPADLTPGAYVWIKHGQACSATLAGGVWRLAGAQGGPGVVIPRGGALYRVVPSQTFSRLGWREFRQAALSDTRLLKEIGLATFVINTFALVIPLYMNAIYDRVLPAQAEMSLWVLSLGVALCLGLEYLLRNERSRALMRLADEFQTACLPQLTHWISCAPLSQALEWGQGAVRGLAALSRLRSLYWNLVGSSAVDLGFALLYLAIIAWMGGLLALVPAAVMAFGAWTVWRYDRQLHAMGSDDPPSFSLTAERFALYRGANAEATLASEYLIATEAMRLKEQRRYALQSRCGSVLALLGNAQTLLIVILAYYLVLTHRMQPAGIFAAILLSGRMLQPLTSLMTALPSLRQMNGCLRQVNQTLAAAAEVPTSNTGMIESDAGWSLLDVSFRYEAGAPEALKAVSLEIRRGERIAIVGPAAGGKTTLLKLLLGVLTPTQGSVAWAGCPLTGDQARALRDQTHYGWQSAELIGATPRDYLSLERAYSNQDMAACLQQTGLAPAVARWPQGLATPIAALPALGRRTLELLGLARLLLSRRAIYALDAPSEGMDPQAEQQLLSTLKARCAQGATLLLITDKAHLLALVDRVIYLNQGQIRFDGSVPAFEALMARGAG